MGVRGRNSQGGSFRLYYNNSFNIYNFFQTENSIDSHIQFNVELENGIKLPFLDILIVKSDPFFIICVYGKHFSVSNTPHAHSNHLVNQTIGVLYTCHCTPITYAFSIVL